MTCVRTGASVFTCGRTSGARRKRTASEKPGSRTRRARPAPRLQRCWRSSAAPGTRAVARLFGNEEKEGEGAGLAASIDDIVADAKTAVALAATAAGLADVGSPAPSGAAARTSSATSLRSARGSRARAISPGAHVADLGNAIARYQAEVVGMKHPDGRIDPGRPTLAALQA